MNAEINDDNDNNDDDESLTEAIIENEVADEVIEVPKAPILLICKKCNSEIKNSRKTFCSDKCAKAFHSLKRYHKIKASDDYKTKRRLYKIKLKRNKIILSLPTEQQQEEV